MKENQNTVTQFVGDTVNNKRKDNDFYPTPQYAVQALLNVEKFEGSIWECACGDGAISKVLENNGYSVVSSDLIDRGYGVPDIDFLQADEDPIENIITNPPFSLCTEFIIKSKKIATNKIAMFLKTTALEGVKRNAMWIDKDFPFARMYQFVNRVSFGKEEGTHTKGV